MRLLRRRYCGRAVTVRYIAPPFCAVQAAKRVSVTERETEAERADETAAPLLSSSCRLLKSHPVSSTDPAV